MNPVFSLLSALLREHPESHLGIKRAVRSARSKVKKTLIVEIVEYIFKHEVTMTEAGRVRFRRLLARNRKVVSAASTEHLCATLVKMSLKELTALRLNLDAIYRRSQLSSVTPQNVTHDKKEKRYG